jgi:(p)ppGpp synthase/HD superfamily hydrolase
VYTPERYSEALRFAAERHHGQVFPDTELPYLLHVVEVTAEVIAALPGTPGIDADLAVQCALLHDAIEDTSATYDDVKGRFGVAVADGVLALSKDDQLPKQQQMPDSLHRIQAQPPSVWIVKLADRTANLRGPRPSWSAEKRRAYRDEGIVIADALGAASAVLEARLRARIAAYDAYL